MPTNKTKKDSELVTNGFLKTEMKRAFNEQNKRNLAVFVTKQDLKEGLGNLREELRGDFNKTQTYLEKIVGKLDKKEEKNVMHNYQHKLAEDRLADHDKRIEKLERVVA